MDDNIEPIEGEPVDPKDLKSSKGWLAVVRKAEKTFQEWQDRSDGIDKQYANLSRLAAESRERWFQLFWSNIQVMGPSIYSRPPVPVVVPKFKDQRPIPRAASELLERSSIVSFEDQDLDAVMRAVRDDLNIVARGVIWITYEAAQKGPNSLGQQVCIEHKDRKDFVHDPVRNWKDVDWVCGWSWLTKTEARKRFKSTSGDLYQDASYEVRKGEDNNETDGRKTARFGEVWCKSLNKVLWIAEGCDKFLDEGAPHLELQDFFPCPRPAYGTTQRGSLIPVPDFMLYKDQLSEINEVTARISALTESVRLKGFYPGGAGEIADAVETALKSNDDTAIMIPVANWALLGGGTAANTIVWLPIDQVVSAITALIELRGQLIQDVYQIMGLSDIMRGQTDPNETNGAQQLKSQYGSVRIRDKQDELVRIARDTTRIMAEIMAENFTGQSLLDMSQMSIPSDADVKKQIAPLATQLKTLTSEIAKAQKDPEVQQMAKANPDQAKQIIGQFEQQAQQLQQQIQQIAQTVTIEQVMKFLRDNRTRAFTLDIETDSTVAPDEDEQKQRMSEYVTAVSALLSEALPVVKEVPQAAPLFAEILKKLNSTFRVGRDFEQVVDEFADQMKQIAATPPDKGPSPEVIKAQSDQQIAASKAQSISLKSQLDSQKSQSEAQIAQLNLQLDQAVAAKDAELHDKEIELERYKADLEAATKINVAQITAKTANDGAALDAYADQQIGLQDNQHEAALQQSEQAHEQQMATQQQAAAQQAQAADQQHQQTMQQSDQAAQADPGAAPPPQTSDMGPVLEQIGQALSALADAHSKPRTITTPDGRTYTSRVN